MKVLKEISIQADPRLRRNLKNSGLKLGDPVASGQEGLDHLGVITGFVVCFDEEVMFGSRRIACHVSQNEKLFWLSDLCYCPTEEEQLALLQEVRRNRGLQERDSLAR
jgi:hypothetical protein